MKAAILRRLKSFLRSPAETRSLFGTRELFPPLPTLRQLRKDERERREVEKEKA